MDSRQAAPAASGSLVARHASPRRVTRGFLMAVLGPAALRQRLPVGVVQSIGFGRPFPSRSDFVPEIRHLVVDFGRFIDLIEIGRIRNAKDDLRRGALG
jgi:hypothetical protein